MADDEEIIRLIRDYCSSTIFERKSKGKKSWDVYRDSWLRLTEAQEGAVLTRERLSRFTTQSIQKLVLNKYEQEGVKKEKKVGTGSELAFDLWNGSTRTAFEICLGAPKNEFEKDVIKGLLDNDTVRLVIFFRNFRTGKKDFIFDEGWFDHPAQRQIVERVGMFKLKVDSLCMTS